MIALTCFFLKKDFTPTQFFVEMCTDKNLLVKMTRMDIIFAIQNHLDMSYAQNYNKNNSIQQFWPLNKVFLVGNHLLLCVHALLLVKL